MLVLPPIVAGYVADAPGGAGEIVERRGPRRRSPVPSPARWPGSCSRVAVFVDSFGVERVRPVFLNVSPS